MNHRLENWLASATLDLAVAERQRIREDIHAHATDARDHLLGQGLSAADADARAVADLGDPRVARAAFLRTCYTVSDERRLEKLLGRSWWTLPYAWIGIALPLVLPILRLFDIPLDFQQDLGWSDQQLVIGVVIALVMTPLYYFEPRIKSWLHNRFSSNGVIVVQVFMTVIAFQSIASALEDAFQIAQSFATGKFTSPAIGTWFVVIILAYRWIAQQAPLTLKTIRRSRA